MARQKVVIVGGGVAGLTAAHELIERDFDVVVYERRASFGGKASSAKIGEYERPGEHGFRFFPGWYRHVPDTMRRIPFRGSRKRAGDRTVHDRLVPTQQNLLLQYDQEPLPVVLHAPKSTDQAQALLAFARQMQGRGLPIGDFALFFQKLAEFLRTPIEERKRKYDQQSWWDFVDANARSETFRTLTVASTRTLVAAKAEEASAYTIATMAVRTLFDAPFSSEMVLDGPTSDVWIDPWVKYLEGRGVQFEPGFELDSITFKGEGPTIENLVFYSSEDLVTFRNLRRLQQSRDEKSLESNLQQFKSNVRQFHGGIAKLADRMRTELLLRDRVHPGEFTEILTDTSKELETFVPKREIAEADYFVFALPVEQMAYYVNRSVTMQSYDPSLMNIVRLTTSLDWMAGIQFYLNKPLDVPPGHIVCADSEWALTALEQTQFWRDVELPEGVESILSVDISAWDRKGRMLQKEAFRCTQDEIAIEVWAQLKASLNRRGQKDLLRDDMLSGGKVQGNFHIDDSIVDRFDRKKQAAYARGFDRAMGDVRYTSDILLAEAAAKPEAPFIAGDRLQLNAEPLLINRPGYLRLRPDAATKINNMFLAADYVKTETNLASMEGANEAARHAVNAILKTSGSKHDPCPTWRFEDGEILTKLAALSSFLERLPGARTTLEAASGAVSMLGAIAGRATDNLKQLWKKP